MYYIDVILPLPVRGLFTYSLPQSAEHTIDVGSRVIVQFGAKKIYTAIVARIYETTQKPDATIKEIISVLDEHPIISPLQLKLWEWISMYYMCTLGDVYKAALPSVLKLESETSIIRNKDFDNINGLSSKELEIFHHLSDSKSIRISELSKSSKINNVVPIIKSLVDLEAITINEDIRHTYSPKTKTAIRLSKKYTQEELNRITESLQKTKKQLELFNIFLDIEKKDKLVFQKNLLAESNISNATLNELIKKGILETYQHQIDRLHYGETNTNAAHLLNENQEEALIKIKTSFKDKDITLLHGVTSSGKTEIYIQLIKEKIEEGKQVLYLLPEIALTTQITERLKSVFGNKLAVYHSKFTDNERAEIWNKLLTDVECQVILGARSAVFLPFNHLDLIIVDEEHESSYKQQDPAPRYNARNTAIMLANMCSAKVLLGSATPSIESYFNAKNGRYGLVNLDKRYENISLPQIVPINTKELRRTKQMKSILSPPLTQQIREALDKKEQIILFQNRRGFASMLECKTCSWTPHCNHCDVSLTYHKGQHLMICHYCGATYSIPTICADCGTDTLNIIGYGTERIEEEVQETFPEAIINRMDLDTTRSRRAYERIISAFEEGKTNILIGTQMVSKGLDFDNVSIVGILNADNMLNYPDFRAHERAFQLMTQVSGRAGRKNKQGLVLLQTAHPAHPIITFVKNNDYESFYQMQLEERKIFNYPPFSRIITIIVRHKKETTADRAAVLLGDSLRQILNERVLGPTRPPISRIQTLYIRKILLKIENNASVQKVRNIIEYHQNLTSSHPEFKQTLIHYDVDPM